MTQGATPKVYEKLGLRRVISGSGIRTVLGGTVMSPKALAAMEEANQVFVEMEELLEKAGQAVADMIGAAAAHITSGCAAALAMGAAGIMTGSDLERVARLPNTTGMKNEFLIQRRSRYIYERCATTSGAVLIDVGDENGTTASQIVDAIGPDTAGILYVAHVEGSEGTVPLSDVVAIARDKGISVLLDAAFQIHPVERMTELAQSGADVVCFSAKYFKGPNSTGFLCGPKESVDAAALNGFMAYETGGRHSLGRGYKLDRQDVVATVTQLEEWLQMDHQKRLDLEERRFQVLQEALGGIPQVRTEQWFVNRYCSMQMNVILDEAALGKTAVQVKQELMAGDPAIFVFADENKLVLAVDSMDDGDEHILAWRLRDLLQG